MVASSIVSLADRILVSWRIAFSRTSSPLKSLALTAKAKTPSHGLSGSQKYLSRSGWVSVAMWSSTLRPMRPNSFDLALTST